MSQWQPTAYDGQPPRQPESRQRQRHRAIVLLVPFLTNRTLPLVSLTTIATDKTGSKQLLGISLTRQRPVQCHAPECPYVIRCFAPPRYPGVELGIRFSIPQFTLTEPISQP